jgi:hypothetical protein
MTLENGFLKFGTPHSLIREQRAISCALLRTAHGAFRNWTDILIGQNEEITLSILRAAHKEYYTALHNYVPK